MLKLNLESIKAEIDNAAHGQKRALAENIAAQLNISTAGLYRKLQKEFGPKKKSAREKQVDQDLIDEIAKIKVETADLSKSARELATEDCIEILIQKGVPGAEKLTRSTVDRRLYDVGFRIKKPRVIVEPEYANQEHQLDFSRSKYFQLHKPLNDGDDWLLKVSGKELHYKQDDNRLRTWITAIKESYSRIRIVRVYAATGEAGWMGLNFLNWAYTEQGWYLPEILKTDNGAFAKFKDAINLIGSMGIDFRHSKAYNSASQGKIESNFKSLWKRYELKLAYRLGPGKTIRLSEYNELVQEFCAEDAQKEHPDLEKKDAKIAYYKMSIQTKQQRQAPEDMLRHAFRTWRCKCDEKLRLRIDNTYYTAPTYASGKWVMVHINHDSEMIGELEDTYGKKFTLGLFKPNRLDKDWKRPKPTYRELIESDLEREKQEERQRENRIFLKPKIETTNPKSPFVEKEIEFPNANQARVYVAHELRRIGVNYQNFADIFEPLLKAELRKDKLDIIINEIQSQINIRIAL